MANDSETLEGYVLDIARVRKNARDDLLEKAETHTKECALTGHRVESGYALVTEDGQLMLLDAGATLKIVDLIRDSEAEQGHRARVTRSREDGDMATTTVEEI